MVDDPPRVEDQPTPVPVVERQGGSGVIFALVALALILAIGFFYLTNERREDRQADAITQAADSVDSAAKIVGDAAKDAANDLRNNH